MMKMIENELAGELISFFDGYLLFYREFLDLETRKLGDMRKNMIDTLDKIVKEEQVFMLKARGLEIERDRLVSKTPLKKANFRELLPFLDGAFRERAHTLYEELSDVLINIRETNQKCNYLTQMKLNRIKTNLKKLENNVDTHNYNSGAKEDRKPFRILSRKA